MRFCRELEAKVARLEEDLHEVRLVADGLIYSLRAIQLHSPEEIDPLLPDLLRASHSYHAARAIWVPKPERYPGTQVGQWWFRLDMSV